MNFRWLSFLVFLLFAVTANTSALAAAKVLDFSGAYLCKGTNEAVGDYEVAVTLKKSYRNSIGSIGVYELVTETENNETYTGQAVINGSQLAMTFKLSSAKHAEFSTAVGEFKKYTAGKWMFKTHYYEPDDSGGNYGREVCMMQQALKKVIPKAVTPLKKIKPSA